MRIQAAAPAALLLAILRYEIDATGAMRVGACHAIDTSDLGARDFSGSRSAVDRSIVERRAVFLSDRRDHDWLADKASVVARGIRALVSLPLMGVIFGIIGPKSQKAFGIQWRKVGRLNARVEESFSGHALVKVFGREKDALMGFKAENQELFEASFKAQFLSGMMMPAMMFVGNLTYVGIAVLGGLMVASGQVRLGDVQAFIQYSQQFTQPLSELGGMAAVVQSGTASAERVFELLDQPEQEPDAVDAPKPVDGDGTIEFDHVSFSYSAEPGLLRAEPKIETAAPSSASRPKPSTNSAWMRIIRHGSVCTQSDGPRRSSSRWSVVVAGICLSRNVTGPWRRTLRALLPLIVLSKVSITASALAETRGE